MSRQLQSRAGDAQALKACIAAAISGTAVELVPTSPAPASLLGNAICLLTPEGLQLTEPNAAALYLGGECLTAGWSWKHMNCLAGASLHENLERNPPVALRLLLTVQVVVYSMLPAKSLDSNRMNRGRY